jgi:hypothetical protein
MLDFYAVDAVILAEPDTAFLMLLFVARRWPSQALTLVDTSGLTARMLAMLTMVPQRALESSIHRL